VRVRLRESAERERKSHWVGTDYRATEYFNPVDGDEVCVCVCVCVCEREGERERERAIGIVLVMGWL